MSQALVHTATLGTVAGTPLVVDLLGSTVGGDPWAARRVTLSQNYTAINPPGFPDRPPDGVTTAMLIRLTHAPTCASLCLFTGDCHG